MATRADWLALAARAEAATGADPELDEAIYRALGFWWDSAEAEWCAPDSPRAAEGSEPPTYTASIDAALAVVPEGWRWWVNWRYARCWKGWRVEDDRDAADNDAWVSVSAGSAKPALALLAAACRARAEEAGNE